MSNTEKQSAIIMYADGNQESLLPKNGKTFELKEAQDIVGGYIEIVHLSDKCILVVNEEGKIKGLPINMQATVVAKAMSSITAIDCIVGDAILCPSEMLP